MRFYFIGALFGAANPWKGSGGSGFDCKKGDQNFASIKKMPQLDERIALRFSVNPNYALRIRPNNVCYWNSVIIGLF
jgi:hypothetical protein